MNQSTKETSFRPHPLRHGRLEDLSSDVFPAEVSAWDGGSLEFPEGATSIGFVLEGEALLDCAAGTFTLREGLYFSVPGAGRLRGDGCGVVITQYGFDGFFQIGGPIEQSGRLRYIDGCTDSLLIPPVRRGDPCLNLLHIPARTEQTQHTHPSFRAGVIVSGRGRCVTPEGSHALTPGLAFVIPADGLHSFHTQDEALRVIAYHPDSDFGPTDETHPMINRTLIPERHEMPSMRE
jgi:mannose-6-phosphate isomerase-like protein (cupin superfamily)